MTGVVLALAELACGDSGLGASPAQAPVSAGFEGRWVGTLEGGAERNEQFPCRLDLDRRTVDLKGPAGWLSSSFDAAPVGSVFRDPPVLRVRWAGYRERAFYAAFKTEGDKLLVAVGERPPTAFVPDPNTLLFILRPVVPRKP